MNDISEDKLSILKKINTTFSLDDTKVTKIIFVYCPPKVGSTTLVSSLRLSGAHLYKVIHIHDETMLEVLSGLKGVSIKEIIQYNVFLKREVIVIDIYREPLQKKMSEFFGKLSSYHFNTSPNRIITYSLDRIIKRFNQLFPHLANGDHYLEKYPDIVVCPPTSFDFEKKYLIYKKNNLTYLKLRLRDASEWSSILDSALDLRVTIITDYERENLILGNLYKKFKKNYKIPENFVRLIQEDPYFKFYLSTEEQNEYINSLIEITTDECQPFSIEGYQVYNTITTENQRAPDIESQHYFDEGCVCLNCMRMRRLVINDIENGREPRCRLVHSEVQKKIKAGPQHLRMSSAQPPIFSRNNLSSSNNAPSNKKKEEEEVKQSIINPPAPPHMKMVSSTKKINAPAKFNIRAPDANNPIFTTDPNYLRNRPGISMSRYKR